VGAGYPDLDRALLYIEGDEELLQARLGQNDLKIHNF